MTLEPQEALVSTQWLEDHLTAPDVRVADRDAVVDLRFLVVRFAQLHHRIELVDDHVDVTRRRVDYRETHLVGDLDLGAHVRIGSPTGQARRFPEAS